MAIDRVNLGTSLVATAPSTPTAGTSLVVTAGQGARFPRATFRAIIHADGVLPTRDNSEIVDVTAVSTDTFTIVRARDGTAARTVLVGDRISAIIDAGHVSENRGLFGNALINGAFDVWQRATSFATFTDDTYGPDRWNLLSSTTARWTCARDTDVPTGQGMRYSAKLSLASSTNTQVALVQILEAADAMRFANGYGSLSFWAKTVSGEISNLRATILSWDGTEDVVTSDVIATWAGAGTDPTFATNWTKEVNGSNLALTDSWQEFKIENVSIDTASMKNIAVIIWLDDTTVATNDDFWITGVQLNQGRFAMPYQPRQHVEELQKCKRYYQRYTTPHMVGTGSNRVGMQLPVEMFRVPTTVLGNLPIYNGFVATTITGVSSDYCSRTAVEWDVSVGSALGTGTSAITYNDAGSAELTCNAEL